MKSDRDPTSYFLSLFACIAPVLLATIAHAAPIPVGKSRFEFKTPINTKMNVWAYRPERHDEKGAVLFVMHGTKRNADEYRDAWVEHAERLGVLLLVPEFTKADYPSGAGYQLLGIKTNKGDPVPAKRWAPQRIEELFDYVVRENELDAKRYYIYGHSAGGQFVHRMMLLMPSARTALAIPANSGWYTLPTLDIDFPAGLRETPVSRKRLKQALSRDVVVLLGDADTDANHKYLPRGRAAMRQGPHRFARGQFFYDTLKRQANELKTKTNWRVEVVPGVGHSNTNMAPAAAKIIAAHLERASRKSATKKAEPSQALPGGDAR